MRPVKAICGGANIISHQFLRPCFAPVVTLDLGFRNRVVMQVDDPKLGVLYSVLIIFSIRVTCEARRLVRSLAPLEILRSHWFSAETINELACPPQCGWVSGQDGRLV